MEEHSVRELLTKTMENLERLVEVNTIVGEAIESPNGTVIIPVTRVSCGFGAGGSEFAPKSTPKDILPFGGGSGGGVAIQPVGFLIIRDNDVHFQSVNEHVLWDHLIEQVPDFLLKIKQSFGEKNTDSSEHSSPEQPSA